ncbi:hypothetical protein LPB03_07100 [Polaribacter vadi]|uniref:Glycosyl transferase family 1 domain-containing protein n=1 Tax=Polaribacter vadi TaxID=1774273 RepID=A0A1B8TYV2_9FLAO|nr:glycosyltransferase family 4 protein [Polaribacter vadi]AOW17245.1 hypothetical protein LPB03_07100 [Polaribacter vadi]OBY64828.1 hypothetical protein LPB3_05390 [Polaribacter vadi]
MVIENKKPKIMLHIIMPNQVSGPNTASRLIADSYLKEHYNFQFLTQKTHAGGKINFSLIRDLRNQINEFNPDIIHVSGLQGSGFHAVVAAKFSKKKILLTVRGAAIDAVGLSPKLRFIFGKIVEPLTLRLSNQVYTVCRAMEKRGFIQNNTKGRLIGAIHNSAPEIFNENIVQFNIKEKLNLSKDSLIVVIVGRIIYDKGVTYICDAIKRIDDQRVKFVFIGDEPNNMNFKSTLVKEINERKVFFLNKQDKNNVLAILRESDIFLFATLHENLSNALLEACSLGLAVIATNVGGNPEVIKHGYNGILISPKNSLEIVNSINLLVNDDELRKELGGKAIVNIKKHFSQEKILHQVESVYQKMINCEI